jgi:hypothetical protein
VISHLHDHGVHLLRAELELVPAQAVAQAQAHGSQVSGAQLSNEATQLSTHTTRKLLDGGAACTKAQSRNMEEYLSADIGVMQD